MARLTLAQLLAPRSAGEIRERIFGRLNRNDFPVDDFEEGGVVRTVTDSEAEALLEFGAGVIPKVASSGLALEAKGEWLRLLAQQNFLIEPREATSTLMKVTLTVAPGAGPHDVNAGELVVEAATGNRYVLDQAGNLPSGESRALVFKAERPGAHYADGPGTISKLVTSLPGVTVTNDNEVISEPTHTGTGDGRLVVSGLPTAVIRFIVRIISSGPAGAATFEYSSDGAHYQYGGTAVEIPSVVGLGAGVYVGFMNGATSSASFVAGDTYIFSAPGSPIVEQGRDDETDEALLLRIIEQWGALAEVPADGNYERWAKLASAEVTKAKAWPANSADTPGAVRVVIAGAVNPLPGSTVTLVQAYLDRRRSATGLVMVEAATPVEIRAVGTVLVPVAKLQDVRVAAELAWSSYLSQRGMGAKLYSAQLERALLTAGALDTTGVLIKLPDGTTHNTHELASDQVAQKAAVPLAELLTWQATNESF